MRNNYDSIPKNNLVWERLLNWDAKDTSWNWNNWTTTDITWVNAVRGYQSEVASFNGSTSVIEVTGTWNLYDWISKLYVWFWWKPEDVSNFQALLIQRIHDWDNQWNVFFTWTDIRFQVFDNNQNKDKHEKPVSLSIWTYYYIECIMDWTSHTIKVNKDTTNFTGNNSTIATVSNADLFIWSNWPSNQHMKWDMQWLKTYTTKVLTESDRQALYQEWLRLLWQWDSEPDILSWLKAYWDFRWDAQDVSGNGNHWTVNWATLTTDHLGNANSAYNFDWTDDYIQTTMLLDDINNDDYISVSMWINHDTLNWENPDNNWKNFWNILYSDWWNWIQMWLNENNELSLKTYDWSNHNFLESTFVPSTWVDYDYHFEVGVDGMKIYVDWNLEASNTNTNMPWNSWRNIEIWARDWQAYHDWKIHYVTTLTTNLTSWQISHFSSLISNKYIYPYKKWPIPQDWLQLHLDWTNDWTTWYDQSWNWNHWTQSWWVGEGRINQSKYMSFDGSDDEITTNFTVNNIKKTFNLFFSRVNDNSSYIVQYNTTGDQIAIISWFNTNKIELFTRDDSTWTTKRTTIIDNVNNNHIYMVSIIQISSTDVNIYVNANFIKQFTIEGNVDSISDFVFWNSGGSNHFKWKIIEPVIYDRILLDIELQQIYYNLYLPNN